jgi:hypothetical protein
MTLGGAIHLESIPGTSHHLTHIHGHLAEGAISGIPCVHQSVLHEPNNRFLRTSRDPHWEEWAKLIPPATASTVPRQIVPLKSRLRPLRNYSEAVCMIDRSGGRRLLNTALALRTQSTRGITRRKGEQQRLKRVQVLLRLIDEARPCCCIVVLPRYRTECDRNRPTHIISEQLNAPLPDSVLHSLRDIVGSKQAFA